MYFLKAATITALIAMEGVVTHCKGGLVYMYAISNRAHFIGTHTYLLMSTHYGKEEHCLMVVMETREHHAPIVIIEQHILEVKLVALRQLDNTVSNLALTSS